MPVLSPTSATFSGPSRTFPYRNAAIPPFAAAGGNEDEEERQERADLECLHRWSLFSAI